MDNLRLYIGHSLSQIFLMEWLLDLAQRKKKRNEGQMKEEEDTGCSEH